jgi:hypothetical protein
MPQPSPSVVFNVATGKLQAFNAIGEVAAGTSLRGLVATVTFSASP